MKHYQSKLSKINKYYILKTLKYIPVFLLVFAASVFSQTFNLEVYYSRADNDLNKTIRTETYSISGRSMVYSLDYEGKSMPNEIDEKKECELSNLSFDRVLKSIADNKIARDESIYHNESVYHGKEFYLKITIRLVMDGAPTTILLEGESNRVMDNKIYLDVIDFIKDLRVAARDC